MYNSQLVCGTHDLSLIGQWCYALQGIYDGHVGSVIWGFCEVTFSPGVEFSYTNLSGITLAIMILVYGRTNDSLSPVTRTL